MLTIKILTGDDLPLLLNVADGVFDHPVNESYAREFLNDPRHHLVVAVDGGVIVGSVSAIHYVHPDKAPELWINEVGVASSYQRQGIAKAIMQELFQLGRELGCKNAWVLTERSNEPANRLYHSVGGQVDSDDTVMYEFDINQE